MKLTTNLILFFCLLRSIFIQKATTQSENKNKRGFVQSKRAQSEALRHTTDALIIKADLNDQPKLIDRYVQRGASHKVKEDQKNARAYATRALHYADASNSKDIKKKTHVYHTDRTNQDGLLGRKQSKSGIAKQSHDAIFNDLLQVLTKLKRKTEIGEGLKEAINRLSSNTHDKSIAHRVVTKTHPYNGDLSEVSKSRKQEYGNDSVKGRSEIVWDTDEILKRANSYKIRQEFHVNTPKHGEAVLVVLNYKKQEKKIHFNYSNNGLAWNLKKHARLPNTVNRTNSINGIISFEIISKQGLNLKLGVNNV